VGAGKLFQPLRVALTGVAAQELEHVEDSRGGRDRSLARIADARSRIAAAR
jgi:hypothetical protein